LGHNFTKYFLIASGGYVKCPRSDVTYLAKKGSLKLSKYSLCDQTVPPAVTDMWNSISLLEIIQSSFNSLLYMMQGILCAVKHDTGKFSFICKATGCDIEFAL
jgi:hypothetical protein